MILSRYDRVFNNPLSFSARLRGFKNLTTVECRKRLCSRDESDLMNKHYVNGFQIANGVQFSNHLCKSACWNISNSIDYIVLYKDFYDQDQNGQQYRYICVYHMYCKCNYHSPTGILQIETPRDFILNIPNPTPLFLEKLMIFRQKHRSSMLDIVHSCQLNCLNRKYRFQYHEILPVHTAEFEGQEFYYIQDEQQNSLVAIQRMNHQRK